MAIDRTDQALNIASKTVQAVEAFMTALDDLKALEAQRASAGITLTEFDAAFAASSVKHVDGASLNAVLNTSIPAIDTFMTTNFHDDNLQKARP